MTVNILIDRIKIPVYDTVAVDDIEERELVFESSTNSLVIRVNDQLIKIPYEPTIIDVLWQKLKDYIEQNSILIPTKRPESPEEGSVYFDTTNDRLMIYVNGGWKQVIQCPIIVSGLSYYVL